MPEQPPQQDENQIIAERRASSRSAQARRRISERLRREHLATELPRPGRRSNEEIEAEGHKRPSPAA
jgi:hypothetical protein